MAAVLSLPARLPRRVLRPCAGHGPQGRQDDVVEGGPAPAADVTAGKRHAARQVAALPRHVHGIRSSERVAFVAGGGRGSGVAVLVWFAVVVVKLS